MTILGILIMVNQVNAQGQKKDMTEHKEKGHVEMSKMVMENIYPQKAEDISPLLAGEKYLR